MSHGGRANDRNTAEDDEGMSMKKYTIAKIDRSMAQWWENVEPLHIDNYMWMDNGYEPEVSAWLGNSGDALHVRFETAESMPKAVFTRMNEPVYKDSCVELFFQPDPGNDRRYMNFEMNSRGALLLGIGQERNGRERVEDNISTFAIKCCTKPNVWAVEYTIPYGWINEKYPHFLPETGHIMRVNLYKCGDETEAAHYGSWNRVTSETPDFHRPQDFGEMIFE